jgi:hypothetical protein
VHIRAYLRYQFVLLALWRGAALIIPRALDLSGQLPTSRIQNPRAFVEDCAYASYRARSGPRRGVASHARLLEAAGLGTPVLRPAYVRPPDWVFLGHDRSSGVAQNQRSGAAGSSGRTPARRICQCSARPGIPQRGYYLRHASAARSAACGALAHFGNVMPRPHRRGPGARWGSRQCASESVRTLGTAQRRARRRPMALHTHTVARTRPRAKRIQERIQTSCARRRYPQGVSYQVFELYSARIIRRSLPVRTHF